MEDQNQPLDEGLHADATPSTGLQITPNIRQYWRESTQWALGFAILGFLYLGFLLLAMLGIGSSRTGMAPGIVMFLFGGAFVFIPTWFLFQFAQQLKKGLQTDETAPTEEAFLNLRRLYQFIGILLIIVLSIYAIALIFGLLMLGRASM